MVQLMILLNSDRLELAFGQASREQLNRLADPEAPARGLRLVRGRKEVVRCPRCLDALELSLALLADA